MARIHVKKIGAAKHKNCRRQKTGERMQLTISDPQKSECPRQENVQRNTAIQGDAQGHDQEKTIEWIEQRRFKIPKKGRTAVKIRIPQSQVAVEQFVKAKISFVNKVAG